MHDIIQFIVDVLVLLGEASVIVFTVSYGVFFNWRKNQAGRALMYFSLGLDALFLLSFLHRFWGDYPGRDVVQLVFYAGITSVAVNLVVQLWRNRHRADPTESMRELEKTPDPRRRRK